MRSSCSQLEAAKRRGLKIIAVELGVILLLAAAIVLLPPRSPAFGWLILMFSLTSLAAGLTALWMGRASSSQEPDAEGTKSKGS